MTNLPDRDAFELPEGMVYLDGNSLGPLPKVARARIARTVEAEWGGMLISGWNKAGWMDLPHSTGDKIARLVGAAQGSVMVADSTSVNLFKALDAALSLTDRPVILSEVGNFPTDLYVAQGLAERRGRQLKTVTHDALLPALDGTVGVLMLTQVDYRTGRRHDMEAVTRAAQAAGAVVIWDLAHSAGAFPVDLTGAGAEFAVGCGYKYLNGGPGAPAFLYVRPDLVDRIEPALAGWMGHAAPFDFDPGYAPGPGITRMRVGTPAILSMSALDAALDLWDGIDLGEIRARSLALTDLFIAEVERETAGHDVRLATPREHAARGSQVSFRLSDGYAVMQALIAEGVIGDFRAPDLIRFGMAPLYNTEEEMRATASTLGRVLRDRLWDREAYRTRAKVT